MEAGHLNLQDFPLMYNYSSPLKRYGIENGALDFQLLLCGQSAVFNTHLSEEMLIGRLTTEVAATLQSMTPRRKVEQSTQNRLSGEAYSGSRVSAAFLVAPEIELPALEAVSGTTRHPPGRHEQAEIVAAGRHSPAPGEVEASGPQHRCIIDRKTKHHGGGKIVDSGAELF